MRRRNMAESPKRGAAQPWCPAPPTFVAAMLTRFLAAVEHGGQLPILHTISFNLKLLCSLGSQNRHGILARLRARSRYFLPDRQVWMRVGARRGRGRVGQRRRDVCRSPLPPAFVRAFSVGCGPREAGCPWQRCMSQRLAEKPAPLPCQGWLLPCCSATGRCGPPRAAAARWRVPCVHQELPWRCTWKARLGSTR